MGNSNQG
ncbi:hypothetical protein YPPY92_4423, partial [Yersinia pestis PY-92]